MKLNKGFRVALIAAVALGAGFASHAASIIETTSSWDGAGSFRYFGEGEDETMGQSFRVTGPETEMNSFTFYLKDVGTVEFEAYVYAWDGDRVSGNALFSTGSMFTTDNNGQQGFEAVTVDTGSLSLNEGSLYIAFLSVSNTLRGTGNYAEVGLAQHLASGQSPYLPGRFFYKNNGANFNGIYNQWGDFGPRDAAFEMTFSAPTLVPVPANIALLGLGITGLVARRRRKAA